MSFVDYRGMRIYQENGWFVVKHGEDKVLFFTEKQAEEYIDSLPWVK